MNSNLDDPLTQQIIGLAMKVHRALGPINFGSERLQFKRKYRHKKTTATTFQSGPEDVKDE